MTSNSPCAACKFLRRKCNQECVFAPYFPPDQPQKFANVHKVFGASNVSKLLLDLRTPAQKEDAVNSLAYEAEARLRDPVYGCVGLISTLQQRLGQVQHELFIAKKELSNYVGPSAMAPMITQSNANLILNPHPHQNPPSQFVPFGIQPMGLGGASSQQQLMIREQQQQRMDLIESQHLAAVVAREQELLRSAYEQQQQQQELAMLTSGIATAGFNHVTAVMPSSMAVVPFENSFQLQQLQQLQQQQSEGRHHETPSQQQPQRHQRTGSDEDGANVGPSSA